MKGGRRDAETVSDHHITSLQSIRNSVVVNSGYPFKFLKLGRCELRAEMTLFMWK